MAPLAGLLPPALTTEARRHARLRRYVLVGTGAAVAGYAAYRLYQSGALGRGRAQLARLHAALAAYADAFGTGAATLRLLADDLHAYLQSDRHEVPPSLRQLARLMQSPEVADTASATVAALVRGVAAGTATDSAAATAAKPASADSGAAAATATAPGSGRDSKGALDRILEALLSDRGHSLVSVAVSLGARNLVAGYCGAQHQLAAADRARTGGVTAGEPDLTNRLLDFLASPRGQQLAVLSVTAFVSSGMRAYLDQTLDLNFYEDLFGAMAKPEHLDAVKQVVGVFARDVVGAYLAGPTPPAAPQAAAQQQQQPQLRLSSSIQELLSGVASRRQQAQHNAQQPEEAAAGMGSPCSSSVSGDWLQQQQQATAAAAVVGAPVISDVDSDVLLRPEAAAGKGGDGISGGDSARSHAGSWAVRTPQAVVQPPVGVPAPAAAAAPTAATAAAPVLQQLRRVREQGGSSGAGMQREGSGNLEWISAVSKEWLNVAADPHGRTVMVELAGTAAKEAAAGVSAALADRFRSEWLLLAALVMLLLAWLAQRLLVVVLG